jgi:hypothetical protein
MRRAIVDMGPLVVFNAAMARSGVAGVGQLMLLQPFVIVTVAALINAEPIRLTTRMLRLSRRLCSSANVCQ